MPQQWILTWAKQQWIRITRMLLGVCPPTRRSKRRLRGTLAHWGTPSDWPSTIDASQLDAIDVQSPFEAQGRGFEHAHGKWHGIVGTTPSTIDASQLDTSRNSDHHALTILPCCLCPYAHASDQALALISISLLTMPGCRWTDGINLRMHGHKRQCFSASRIGHQPVHLYMRERQCLKIVTTTCIRKKNSVHMLMYASPNAALQQTNSYC